MNRLCLAWTCQPDVNGIQLVDLGYGAFNHGVERWGCTKHEVYFD
jgi:hypothetical protein